MNENLLKVLGKTALASLKATNIDLIEAKSEHVRTVNRLVSACSKFKESAFQRIEQTVASSIVAGKATEQAPALAFAQILLETLLEQKILMYQAHCVELKTTQKLLSIAFVQVEI